MQPSTPGARPDSPFSGDSPGSVLATAVLIITVLGVLPFAWDAAPVWKVLGPLVAVAVGGRALQRVWRQVFSTSPRHLGA